MASLAAQGKQMAVSSSQEPETYLGNLRTSYNRTREEVQNWAKEFRRLNRRHARIEDYPDAILQKKRCYERLYLIITGKKKSRLSPYLPLEVWHAIGAYLGPGIKDIQNIRLASRVWTLMGASFFYREFTVRPLRADYRLLTSIHEGNPRFLDRVRTLSFAIGRIDNRFIAEKIAHCFINGSAPEARELLLSLYALYNFRHHDGLEDIARLVNPLSYHSQLDAIKIEPYEDLCQWGQLENMLHGIWPYKTRCDSFQRNAEFLNILQAMAMVSNDVPGRSVIKHLSHQSLSPSFLVYLYAHNPIDLRDLTLPFHHLETLHLNFYGVFQAPLKSFWKGLAVFLQNATNLKCLRFGFDPVLTEKFQSSDWTKSVKLEDKTSWYAPLYLLDFGDCATLETLRLDGLSVCERGMQYLVARYPALKELHLCQVRLREGSFPSFVNFVRNELSLTKFELSGWLQSGYTYWVISRGDIVNGLTVGGTIFDADEYTIYTFETRTAQDEQWLLADTDAQLSEWDPSDPRKWRKFDSITHTEDEAEFVSAWTPKEIVPYFNNQGRDPAGVHYTKVLSRARHQPRAVIPKGNVPADGRPLKTAILRLLIRDSILVETNALHVQDDGEEVIYSWNPKSDMSIDLHREIIARGNCKESWAVFDRLY